MCEREQRLSATVSMVLRAAGRGAVGQGPGETAGTVWAATI